MSERLRIGELAQRSGRSIHALRYYESIGLMPFVSRDSGGRRQYDPQHVEWLYFLERLQRTGMTLAQMQFYANLVRRGRQTLDSRVDLLKEHLRNIDRQIRELNESRALVLSKIAFYEEWKSSEKRPAASWMDAKPAASRNSRAQASLGTAAAKRHRNGRKE